MTSSSSRTFVVLLTTLVTLGCAGAESAVDPFEDSPFALVLEDAIHRPEGGWIQRTSESSQAEIAMSGDWGSLRFHLDMHRWERPAEPLVFEPGDEIVDGPADHGRGDHRDYSGDYAEHSPWVDANLCVREAGSPEECFEAQLITIAIEPTDDPAWVWLSFEASFDELDEPLVGRYRTLAAAGEGLHDHYPRR